MSEEYKGRLFTFAEKDCDSGEERTDKHYLLMTSASLKTTVKIQFVLNYTSPDGFMQLSIDCLALDFVGGVFDVALQYFSDEIEVRDKILQDLKQGSMWYVNGDLLVACEDGAPFIVLYMPQYEKLRPENEKEAGIAFQINQQNGETE